MPDQEDATVALMLEREIDKRVVLALGRLLCVTLDRPQLWLTELDRRLDAGDNVSAAEFVAHQFVDLLLREGSLAHAVRSKLAEDEMRHKQGFNDLVQRRFLNF